MSIVAQGGKLISGNTTLATIYEVRESGTNGLLCKNGCEEQVISIIGLSLIELTQLADTNLTNESASDTAIMIANEYPHHRPQEAIVAIKNGLAGKYGKTYGKLTTMEVMRWVKEYDETDRADFFEQKATQKPKADWKDIDPSIFKQVITSPDQPKKEPVKPKGTDIAQQWMRDFDKGAKMKSGGMFFEIAGQDGEPLYLNIDEYLQHRFKTQPK